jgi:hypothetical protein
MWRIENPELRRATLDFTSSEQGWRNVTQLFADGVQLVNAIELVDWTADDTQLLVCEACGMEGCEQGNWVCIRRAGSLVLILPASNHIWAELEYDKTEYYPPRFLQTHGVAYFDRSTYEDLRSQHSDFPPFYAIQHLNMREATLIFHWEAPAQVFGPPPEVRVRHELIVGTSEADVNEHLNRLEHLIHQQYGDNSHATLRSLSESETPISLYLDASEFIDWKALVSDGSEHRLVIDSRFVIENM